MNLKSWTEGNALKLLEGGEDYYPAIESAMGAAQHSIYFQTYIFYGDAIGLRISRALLTAAQRGIDVHLVVDGFASAFLPSAWIAEWKKAGIHFAVFKPLTWWSWLRFDSLHRLHRKIVLIDGQKAFIGGLNVADDQLKAAGQLSRLDFAVEVTGPVVEYIAEVCARFHSRLERRWKAWLARTLNRRHRSAHETAGATPAPQLARAALVLRDNFRHIHQIEDYYRDAILHAKSDVIICNAYFFPGRKLMRTFKEAAKRGVRIRLMLQGRPEFLMLKMATETLYGRLLKYGVEIYEYTPRLLHAKVAVVDTDWSTVGSCNLDPFSLVGNLEANLVIQNQAFSSHLRARLEELLAQDCEKISVPRSGPLRQLAFGLMRFLPGLLNVSRSRRARRLAEDPRESRKAS